MKQQQKGIATVAIGVVFLSIAAGLLGGIIAHPPTYAPLWVHRVHTFLLGGSDALEEDTATPYVPQTERESAVIRAVELASPAVVSVIVTKELPLIVQEFDDFFGMPVPRLRQEGTEWREVGGGSGFLVSSNGYIVTNRHVVADEEAEYTVVLHDGTVHDATVLARDRLHDIALMKIEASGLSTLQFGNSDEIQIGQSVIAIGNALGQFQGSVSTGIVSGLSRSIIAGGPGVSERLSGVIQTDAAINPGNSGGPLLDLHGRVIGMNTAIAGQAENIGFAVPAIEIIRVYESVREYGRIVRPWLGVYYMPITAAAADAEDLPVDYGALLIPGGDASSPAVVPESPAAKAGLEAGDILLQIDGQRIDREHSLGEIIAEHEVGDAVELTFLRGGEEITKTVTLEERIEEL